MKIFRFIFLVIFIVGILSVNLPVHGENNAVNVDEYNKAVEAYRNVLQNIEQIKILFRKNYYMKRYYLRFYMNNVAYKYYTDYNDEYWNSYFEHFAVNKFTVLDMDSNNIPEVILDITPNNDIMVLYYYDSIVYCYTCIRTELYNLKKDGTFYWQNGWSVNGFDKFELINGIFERRTLAYFGSFSADIISYYISDKEVSDQEFGMFYYEQEQKENADWYDFNDTNIDNLLKTIPVSPKTGDNFIIFIAITLNIIILTILKKKRYKKHDRFIKIKNYSGI